MNVVVKLVRPYRQSTTENPRIIGQTKDDELFVLRAFPH